MVSDRLKEIIFKKLYKDLSCVEIVPYKKEIWFVDRENKCWYFIFCSDGTLWWKYGFFRTFFELFSLTDKEFTPVISSWVEEVLNCRVNTTIHHVSHNRVLVEEVLNCRVNTTKDIAELENIRVEEVLNCRVNTTQFTNVWSASRVEEVLNYRVNKTEEVVSSIPIMVKQVLNYKVSSTDYRVLPSSSTVGEVLEHKVEMAIKWSGHPTINVNEVLRGNDITQ